VKRIDELLQHLAEPGVSELALVGGRLPCVKEAGAFRPVDEHAPTTTMIVQMLIWVGGARHVENLGAKPVQWRVAVSGIGQVVVTAVRRGDTVQARFIADAAAPPRAPSPEPPPVAYGTAPRDALAGDGGASLEIDESPERAVVPHAPATSARDLEIDEGGGRLLGLGVGGRALDTPFGEHPAAAAIATRARAAEGASFSEAPPARDAAPSRRALDGPLALDALLARARVRGASDLHVIASRPLALRVGGALDGEGPPLDAADVERLALSIVPPRLRAQLAADGSCDFALVHPEHGRFRANVARQRTGYKACLRAVARDVPTLESLGLPAAIADAARHHQGLIVVTGPTGHGKTSTLAALVDLLNRETSNHIITVEDPIEFLHPPKRALLSQREVGTHTRSFAAALKASLREDPDVIVVGELRDAETVRMALSASETGHLVLGTMNTPSAAKTIDRLIDLFPPADQGQVRMTLAGGLRLIVSQRLLPGRDGQSAKLFAACELLPGSIALWSLIRDNKTFQIPSLQQRGKALGIVRIEDSIGELVRAGKVSPEAAHAEAPEVKL